MICFYHNDLDGHASGAVVKYWHSKLSEDYPDLDMHEWNYGMRIPWEKIHEDRSVIIVDLSFEPEDVEKLLEITSDVTWIDHHATAIQKLKDFELEGLRRDGTAACELCWEYFFGQKEEKPGAIKLVGDYDVWRYAYGERTKHFKLGFELFETDPGTKKGWGNWTWLFGPDDDATEYYVEYGKPIQKFIDKENKSYVNSAGFYANFEGYRVVCCNKAKANSWLFDSVNPDSYEIMIPYYFDGEKYKYSLYSNLSYINCGEIAQRFSYKGKQGGGHKGAAGFLSEKFLPKFISKVYRRK